MDHMKIKEMLGPWVKIETWHTPHPLDTKRFHQALAKIFDSFGPGVSFNDFEEALTELVNENHPTLGEEFKEKAIHKFALRAENIATYLDDTQ